MEPRVYGFLFLLFGKFCVTMQFPTLWKDVKGLGDPRVLSETKEMLKHNLNLNNPTHYSPGLMQALCMKYAKASSSADWQIMNLPKNHICFDVLVHYHIAEGNASFERLKRSIFRRSSENGESLKNDFKKPQDSRKEQHNVTEERQRNSVFDVGSSEDVGASIEVMHSPGLDDNVERINPKDIQNPRKTQRTHLHDPIDKSSINGIVMQPSGEGIKNEADTGNRPGSSKNGGIAKWVFITIGTTVVIVGLSLFLLTYMYRAHMAQSVSSGKSGQSKEEPERADSLLRIDSPSDGICPSIQELGAVYMPMVTNSSSLKADVDRYSSVKRPRCMGYRPASTGRSADKSDVSETQTCNAGSKLLSRCASSEVEDRSRQCRAESTGSIYNMIKNDGNKLRGGNEDFHRRYVDKPYIGNDFDVKSHANKSGHPQKFTSVQSKRTRQGSRGNTLTSSSSESGWNGSSASSTTSHHSARSYISIVPTSPSGNYIEAGSDCRSLASVKSTTPVKMEWLTKTFSLDRKNELSTYQTSSGMQTEDSVSPPTCKTVLGTPWQFGGAFSNRGGVLQARGSDVILSVLAGSVPRGQAIDIYGAVFTDTTDIRRKLDFPNDESLVTPVVEYLALPINDFKRPLHLHLPHSLSPDFNMDSVKVYTFSVDEMGRVTTSCLPYVGQSGVAANHEAFWEKNQDGSKILITTSHFSGYFCTLCESTSLPSICTMVFGSHVQISQHRREIRVILYIWDRRLTIRDYLERFQKQESEVDRQLLTDMQVPLLNNASSDSRLVMRMEIMGNDEDRQCWRHVARPGGSRLLFKPLQVRRLSEIVHCCRQTDPIRVEWALENHPDVAPGPVFQCCIDILHTPESIDDYEAALSEDLDDLMRTFYVRDLKVIPKHEDSEPPPVFKFERATVKRTLSEALDLKQTEELCSALGITSKDIGNFHKKFSTETEIQVELVEECLRRLGHEKFVSQLPNILDKLHLSHLFKGVDKKGFKQLELDEDRSPKSTSIQKNKHNEQESSLTALKSPYSHASDKSNLRSSAYDRNNLKTHAGKSNNVCSVHQHTAVQHQVSKISDNVLVHSSPSYDFDCEGAYAEGGMSPNLCGAFDVASTEPLMTSNSEPHHHHAATNNKLNSSSGYASVNQPRSHGNLSSNSLPLTHNNLHTLDNFSIVAHADTLEMPQSSVQLPPTKSAPYNHPSGEAQAYPEITEELYVSTSGPQAFVGQKLKDPKDSNLRNQKDETSRKETYGIHSVV